MPIVAFSILFFSLEVPSRNDREAVKKIEEFDEIQTFSVSYKAINSDAKLPQHRKATFSKGLNDRGFATAVNSWIPSRL